MIYLKKCVTETLVKAGGFPLLNSWEPKGIPSMPPHRGNKALLRDCQPLDHWFPLIRPY